jgi:mannose-1-phosphate guanylyltransferase
MNSISIDYGVVERTKKPIYVIRGDFEWSDVGNWAALRRLREAEADGEGNVVSKKSILHDAKNTFIHSQSKRLIAVLGLENLLVVDTEDVLLIADIKQSQEVRRLPEVARERGWNDAT